MRQHIHNLKRKPVAVRQLPDRWFFRSKRAQTSLEFTFCMIVVLIMLYGVVKAFHWTGRDVVFRRMAHDDVLRDLTREPRDQIDPYFYTPVKMDAIWDGN